MKKKFFTTLVLFASLALTACGGNGGNGGASTKHTHDYGTATVVKEATCEEAGESVQKCKICGHEKKTTIKALGHDLGEETVTKPATCKEKGEKTATCKRCKKEIKTEIPALEHTWDDGVASGKCGEPGKIVYTCSACGETKEETTGFIPHVWDFENATTVAASGDGVEYTIAKCKTCHADGYFVAAAKATLSSNAKKKDAPEGCIKMSPDTAYMTVSFVLPEAKSGTFYLRGAMDYWYQDSNNNQNKTYYDQNNGHTDASTKQGNFKLEVGPDEEHLTNVELPDNTSLKFSDMLPKDVGFTIGSTSWSTIGDCIVGAASLSAGLNMIKFTRVDSYNLAVHDFLFVVPQAA